MTQEALGQTQEPVAWPCLIDTADFSKGTVTIVMQCDEYKVSAGTHFLSTAPPQRTWVGMDDDELTEAWHWGGCEPHIEGAHFKALYQYFEAKLKDKNHVAQKTD